MNAAPGGFAEMEDAGLVVVGGGPAGLMCAIAARIRDRDSRAAALPVDAARDVASHAAGAVPGSRVVVLEKMPRPGIKLLATGSGRCNITHSGEAEDFLSHYGSHGRFLKPALFGFTSGELLSFFESERLSFVTDENGKVFPESGGARAVLDALLALAARHGVEVRAGSPVISLMRGKEGFILRASSAAFRSHTVCIATGGASYPGTGSTGEGYVLAASLGHDIVEPAPCLTPATVNPWPFAGCSGFALRERRISVFRDGKKLAEGSGDILFTHTGLSGPGILDLSRNIRAGDELSFALALPEQDAEAALLGEIAAHGKRELRTVLRVFGLPDSLARAAAIHAGLDPSVRACDIDRAGRKALAACLSACTVRVSALGDFTQAMSTSGGVDLGEVNAKSMESRLCPGLFFAGEVLDIDGDTGGYNLQAAFSTGWLAGISAARRIEV